VAESVLAAAKLSGAGFWEIGLYAMKLAVTTFIIPFAFVFNPELMAFPNFSLKMGWAVLEVLMVQWTTSVLLYGYFTRKLGWMENSGFLVAVLLGYTAIMRPDTAWTWAALGATAAMIAVVTLRRSTAPAKSAAKQPA
jgi:TRAP-type uncharacterized transport system fused permease subunit